MTILRSLILVLAVATLVTAAVTSPGNGRAAGGGCTSVAYVYDVVQGANLSFHLDPASSKCKCPSSRSCTVPARNQLLFANESIFSGDGGITVNSARKNIPWFTCSVTRRGSAVLFPSAKGSKGGVPVLRLLGGASSCRVDAGPWQHERKPNVVFLVGATRITVRRDPVFGLKKTSGGSLVQVRAGALEVGAKSLHREQQAFVPGAARTGAVTRLKPDPVLQKKLCALTPVLHETGVTETTGGNAGSHPQGLAPDAKGNIWFTDNGTTPAVGRVDLGTGLVSETTAGLGPGDIPRWIAADAHGVIWFTVDGPRPAVARLDPATGVITEFRNGLGATSIPWAIAFDRADGRLWFTDQSRTAPAIGTLDPATGAIKEYRTGLNGGSHPEGIDVDRKGNVWFTDDNDPKPALGTIDRTTHRIHEYSAGLVPGSLPRGISAAPDGKVWFADERTRPPHNSAPNAPGNGLIGNIDPSTKTISEFAIAENGGNKGSIPEGLAPDTKGHVWFTDDGATKAIGTIDVVTGAVTENRTGKLAANSEPIGIVLTPTGLWFTDQKPTPRIGRLTSLPSC